MGWTCYVCDSGFNDYLEFQAHLGTHPGRQEGELSESDLAHAKLLVDADRDVKMRRLEREYLVQNAGDEEEMALEDRVLLKQQKHEADLRILAAEARFNELGAGHEAVKAQIALGTYAGLEAMTYDQIMGDQRQATPPRGKGGRFQRRTPPLTVPGATTVAE